MPFRSSNPIPTSRRKSRVFQRDVRIGLLVRKVFEAHRISHHPTRNTITPYNSSDAGLTATMLLLLLLLLLTTTRRGTPCSPPASSAYRHPVAAVRVIDDLFFSTPLLPLLLLLLCSLWRLSTKSNATVTTMKRMRAPRAPNERFARGKGRTKTCALAQQAAQRIPPTTRELATKRFSTDFRLPHSRVSNAPRKSTKTKQKLQTRSD